jgi:hypothetical protein
VTYGRRPKSAARFVCSKTTTVTPRSHQLNCFWMSADGFGQAHPAESWARARRSFNLSTRELVARISESDQLGDVGVYGPRLRAQSVHTPWVNVASVRSQKNASSCCQAP